MSNNSSDVDACHSPDWFPRAQEILIYMDYYILLPVLFFLSWIPSIFTAIAFNRQYRKEASYIYQRVYVVHLCIQSLIMLMFGFGRRLSGWSIMGAQRWFTTNYFLMWYTARLTSPLLNSVVLISLMLLTSMAFDRLLALITPVYYQAMNRKRLAIGLIVSSYLLGLSVSVFDLPRIQVATVDDEYRLVIDSAYTSLLVVQLFSMFRNTLDALFAVLLALFNTITLILFVKRSRKAVFQRSNNRERDNRRLERSLLILTISQGYLVFIEQPLVVFTFALIYTNPRLADCLRPILAPGLEVASLIFHTPNIIQLYLFSRPFTDMLRKLSCVQYFQRNQSHETDASNRPERK